MKGQASAIGEKGQGLERDEGSRGGEKGLGESEEARAVLDVKDRAVEHRVEAIVEGGIVADETSREALSARRSDVRMDMKGRGAHRLY